MKTTIRIQNFKSLEDVTLELAPTTVFLGPNGAGKSSVLKCLEFVSKNLNTFYTKPERETKSKATDDGLNENFYQLVYNNDINRKIIFEFNHQKDLSSWSKSSPKSNPVDKGEGAWWTEKGLNTFLNQLDLSLFSKKTQEKFYRLYNPGIVLYNPLEPTLIDLTDHRIAQLNFSIRIQFGRGDGKIKLENITMTDNASRSYLVFSDNTNSTITNGFHSKDHLINEFFQEVNKNGFSWMAHANNPNLERTLVIEAILFYKNKIESLNRNGLENTLINTIVQIAKFTSFFPSIFHEHIVVDHIKSIRNIPDEQALLKSFSKYKYDLWGADSFKVVELRDPNDKRIKNNAQINASSSQHEENIPEQVADSKKNQIIYGPYGIPDRDILDKITRLLEIEEIINDLQNSKKNIKRKHDKLIRESKEIENLFYREFLGCEKSLIFYTTQWLKRLNLAKEVWFESNNNTSKLKVKSFSGAIADYSESSSGMIQLYPIILNRYYSDIFENSFPSVQTILIEQPELHLHPALHSEVAELCSNNTISPSTSVNFIVETHSEHLIRGYQLLIAKEKINPEKIRFYYFNPVDNKTKVTHLKIDKLGNFITPWPNGFFSEASELSYKLLEEQLKRQK